jgi:hypothetical protein
MKLIGRYSQISLKSLRKVNLKDVARSYIFPHFVYSSLVLFGSKIGPKSDFGALSVTAETSMNEAISIAALLHYARNDRATATKPVLHLFKSHSGSLQPASLLHLRQTRGNKVDLPLKMIKGHDGIIEAKIALGQFKVVYRGGRQLLDEVTQVIAEIPDGSTQKRHR